MELSGLQPPNRVRRDVQNAMLPLLLPERGGGGGFIISLIQCTHKVFRPHHSCSHFVKLQPHAKIVKKKKIFPSSACSVAVKLMDLDPQGRRFDPWCDRDKSRTAVGHLSKALNPALFQGVCHLLSLINCKSLWIKASAK